VVSQSVKSARETRKNILDGLVLLSASFAHLDIRFASLRCIGNDIAQAGLQGFHGS
jgi:hypothetical protein